METERYRWFYAQIGAREHFPVLSALWKLDRVPRNMDVCVLEGRIAVVTGGTRVGAAIAVALALARAGAAIGVRESRGRR